MLALGYLHYVEQLCELGIESNYLSLGKWEQNCFPRMDHTGMGNEDHSGNQNI